MRHVLFCCIPRSKVTSTSSDPISDPRAFWDLNKASALDIHRALYSAPNTPGDLYHAAVTASCEKFYERDASALTNRLVCRGMDVSLLISYLRSLRESNFD